MHNALTKKDIELMQKELDERRIVLRPKLLEAVKVARAFGDLSENFEYKAAKQEKNKNESRIRFLENMIRTAHVILVKMSDHQIIQRFPVPLPQIVKEHLSSIVVACVNEHGSIFCLNEDSISFSHVKKCDFYLFPFPGSLSPLTAAAGKQ